jgi:uncharacterized membrane protein
MTHAARIDWKMPLALLLLSAIPIAAGIARLAGLAGNPEISTENARFVEAPVAVLLHILSASLFCIVGALQFSSRLRQASPQWHRAAGRIVLASGICAALSGVWMTVSYPIPPELQGGLLYGVRVCVGLAMVLSIGRALSAVMGGDIATHRAWMIRAYALGQGAGMQVVLLLPWMLVIGKPTVLQRDVLMGSAWLINLVIAQRAIQRGAAICRRGAGRVWHCAHQRLCRQAVFR